MCAPSQRLRERKQSMQRSVDVVNWKKIQWHLIFFLLFKVMLFLCGVLKWWRIITSEHFLANGLFYPNISAGASVLLLFLKEPCCSCTLLYNCIILSRQMQYYSVQYKRIERGAITLELQSSCYASYLSAGYSVLGFVPCHSGDS